MNAASDLFRVLFSTHPVGLVLWAHIAVVLFFVVMLLAKWRTGR